MDRGQRPEGHRQRVIAVEAGEGVLVGRADADAVNHDIHNHLRGTGREGEGLVRAVQDGHGTLGIADRRHLPRAVDHNVDARGTGGVDDADRLQVNPARTPGEPGVADGIGGIKGVETASVAGDVLDADMRDVGQADGAIQDERMGRQIAKVEGRSPTVAIGVDVVSAEVVQELGLDAFVGAHSIGAEADGGEAGEVDSVRRDLDISQIGGNPRGIKLNEPVFKDGEIGPLLVGDRHVEGEGDPPRRRPRRDLGRIKVAQRDNIEFITGARPQCQRGI